MPTTRVSIVRHLASTVLPAAAVLVVTSMLAAGCATVPETNEAKSSRPRVAAVAPTDAHDEHHYLFEYIQARTEAMSGQRTFDTVSDLLPNTKYTIGGQQRPLTERVVVGVVSDVTRGFGFLSSATTGDNPPEQVQFDDPMAQWKTIHLQVSAERELGGEREGKSPTTAPVGLAVGQDADFEALKADLMSGKFVFFLERSPVFFYEPQRLAIVEDGALLIPVNQGRLTLPALSDDTEQELLAGTPTLAQLIEQSRRPERIRS